MLTSVVAIRVVGVPLLVGTTGVTDFTHQDLERYRPRATRSRDGFGTSERDWESGLGSVEGHTREVPRRVEH